MARCRKCHKHILIQGNTKGYCRQCHEEILRDSSRIMSSIRRLEQLIDTTHQISEKLPHIVTLIDYAKDLVPFEQSGISFEKRLPSELVEQYTVLHDRLAANQQPERLNDAIRTAQQVLAPFEQLYRIKSVLDSLKKTGALCQETGACRCIAIINHKGGVGKTTTAMNLSAALALMDKRVLAIDFDPQANLTDGLGCDETTVTAGAYELLKGTVEFNHALRTIDGTLDIIPASILLARAEKEFSKTHANMYLLRKIVNGRHGYDFIIIDCPPSLGILTLNALAAVGEIIIPLLPEYYSLKGMRKLYDVIEFVRKKINTAVQVSGVVATRYDERKNLHREVFQKIRDSLGDRVFYSEIRESISLAEASSFGKSIFNYQPDSNGAEDYRALARLVLMGKPENDGKDGW
jgi:chromosome partitioning protein